MRARVRVRVRLRVRLRVRVRVRLRLRLRVRLRLRLRLRVRVGKPGAVCGRPARRALTFMATMLCDVGAVMPGSKVCTAGFTSATNLANLSACCKRRRYSASLSLA